MRFKLVCAALALILATATFAWREPTRTAKRALAQAEPPTAQPAHDAGAGSGATVIIEIPPPPPIDAHGVDYAAPLYIDPGAPPGTEGNGKPEPRNTAPDAAPP